MYIRIGQFFARCVSSFGAVIFLFAICSQAAAQSGSQNFPTPITTSQVSGEIPARDVGDSRLTTYYYVFGSDTGDVFINVLTKNFNGDVDVFTAAGLRPITKIVVYADIAENETGRALYMELPTLCSC